MSEGTAGAAGPSLDLCSESVDGPRSRSDRIEALRERIRKQGGPAAVGVHLPPEICPKRPYWVQSQERRELRYPASCDAYRCDVCGPRKAEQAAALMTWAIRTAAASGLRSRLVTLTRAPETHQQRRQKIRDLTRWAKNDLGIEFEIGWAVETGSKTGMVHIHGIQWGSQKIPQAALQDRWGSIVDVRAVRTPAAGVYAVKEALTVAGYTVKGATNPAQLADHLDLNGGRAAHWSRGFLHGMTKREALGTLRAELSNGEVQTWRLVPAWTR